MKRILTIAILASLLFSSCEDMFEPAIENNLELETANSRPLYAQGLLLNGYNRIPSNSYSFDDVATDNAVSNDKNNSYLKSATGQWTSINNPFDQWRNSYAAIQYLNNFLSLTDQVEWAMEPKVSILFNDRMKGEAYGLRALFMFHLLQAHAGKSSTGEILGVPIHLTPETVNSDFNQPRASFEACMQQLYDDIKKAEDLLPMDYENISNDSQVPAKYAGSINFNDYNRVFGSTFKLRMTKRIAQAIRARAALLAASPAYSEGSKTTWEQAATYAGQVIQAKGGPTGIDSKGFTWYIKDVVDGLTSGSNPAEILWRTDKGNSNSMEQDHFPPTLFGRGRLNPTQNLVDAFPMENGYPIADANSTYNKANPYDKRDPRLKAYIIVNGATAGVSTTAINTTANSPTNDGLNKVETSTRTGYYLKKLLRQDVNLNPSSSTQQMHFNARIRMTEMYLAYAEAANEAWGPTGMGTFTFSAYDIIKAIRRRAGVGTNNGDPYLEQVKNNKDEMRQLIRNERRLELCFEGFRFWDLRRWKMDINVAATGISITNNNYTEIPVENRLYETYMNYGPIPYSEVLKYSNLAQNIGWN
ncbi:RagB/SusD family nutrient uptake outer membrane protein [Sphingobacterium athyrii]|uniref:RagB/SusD family nutrient uptake outer membrane protein n=1 Tax=Sphingobacterium athyrii TaxID=2152717 RepID=A0A363NT81_9SPHI|nr:RagB/SusD family nutrient uptake outer membrane protein [Sphingobacterium athyrii]PUV23950.1 RagB/SusD family nutrient uptake outer membrane protein [Sphingobacterium athyrii]